MELHRDHLCWVRAITGPTGARVEATVYKPYGERVPTINLAVAPEDREDKGWIGERFDPETGLQYLNARYFDPYMGMFLQPDWWEVTKPGVGTNRYAYSFGDPVNLSDPNGNVVDNWGTKDNPTAHDSNGFTSTYNGEGQPDDVSYASWNDHKTEDYDHYMNDPAWDPTREGKIGVLTKEVAWSAGKYGKTGREIYGRLEKMPAADYFHPGASGRLESGDAIFGLVPGSGLLAGLTRGLAVRAAAETFTGYVGIDASSGTVAYVGITGRALQTRVVEHLSSTTARAGLNYSQKATFATKLEARIWEQRQINSHGLKTLLNKRNEIAPKNWERYGITQ